MPVHIIKSNRLFDFILGSGTITLSKPQILKQQKNTTSTQKDNVKTTGSPVKTQQSKPNRELSDALVQTISIEISKRHQIIQTDENIEMDEMNDRIEILKRDIDKTSKQLYEAMALAQKRTEEILILNKEKVGFESTLQNLKDSNSHKDIVNEKLRFTIDELKNQLKYKEIKETNQIRENVNQENKSLLLALKQLEHDKNAIMVECKELLNNEREEYAKSVNELNVKVMELQSKLDRYV